MTVNLPDYRRIAREAVPIRADCFGCSKEWTGPTARTEAMAHREAEGHAVWVVCRPKEEGKTE